LCKNFCCLRGDLTIGFEIFLSYRDPQGIWKPASDEPMQVRRAYPKISELSQTKNPKVKEKNLDRPCKTKQLCYPKISSLEMPTHNQIGNTANSQSLV